MVWTLSWLAFIEIEILDTIKSAKIKDINFYSIKTFNSVKMKIRLWHTIYVLHKSNLKVLAKIEKSIKQQEVLEQINPTLKS